MIEFRCGLRDAIDAGAAAAVRQIKMTGRPDDGRKPLLLGALKRYVQTVTPGIPRQSARTGGSGSDDETLQGGRYAGYARVAERLADISAHITGIHLLGAVLNCNAWHCGDPRQQARSQLVAVETYAATIVAAIARALAFILVTLAGTAPRPTRLALVLSCAEQGFGGTSSERVLDAMAPDLPTSELLLTATRGQAAIAERGVATHRTAAFPSHSPGIPKLADQIVVALYTLIATGEINRLDANFCQCQLDKAMRVKRKHLPPVDTAAFPLAKGRDAPLLNLAPATLLRTLTADYLHALLCEAALHSFAAENQARMEVTAAACNQMERQFATLQSTE